MPEWLFEPRAVSVPVLNHIRDGCLGSPLVGASPLAGTFMQSRGFAVSFRRDGREQVLERFGFLRAFVELALRPAPHRQLWSGSQRFLARWRRAPNAYYLNVLILPAGAGVGPHVDTTLREVSGVEEARPSLVSVLYLEVPRGAGGELVLTRGAKQVCTVRPEAGTMLHFRGDLRHEVRAMTGLEEGAQRVSVVCEQYCLPKDGLQRMPKCRVQSMAGFAAYLAAQKGKEPPEGMVLDED